MRLLFVLALALWLRTPSAVAQDDVDLIDDLTPAVERARADEPHPADAAEQREKERHVLAGMAAITGIVIVGVALIALIVLWGGRLRRMNREPLPSTNVQNEFWFLRPPKPPVSDRGPDAPSEDIER